MVMQHFNDIDYLNCEIESLKHKIKMLKLYHSGHVPEVGYIWQEDDDGNFEIIIDKNNLSESHPDFVNYFSTIKNLSEREAYKLWHKNIMEPSIDNLFKKTYTDVIQSLMPDGKILMRNLRKDKK